jgi:hypothetical protein
MTDTPETGPGSTPANDQNVVDEAEQLKRDGRWPRPIQRLSYDFRSARSAPNNDGIVRPAFTAPPWLDRVSEVPEALSVATEARKEAMAAAKTAEDKAATVVQTSLTLLTITVALGAYQLKFAFDRGDLAWVTLLPIAGALLCLALAAFEASEINRVGIYRSPQLKDLADLVNGTPTKALLLVEEEGRFLARWTANHKHSALMQARAWFSRGLTLLIIAGIVAGACRAGANSVSPGDDTTPHRPTPHHGTIQHGGAHHRGAGALPRSA